MKKILFIIIILLVLSNIYFLYSIKRADKFVVLINNSDYEIINVKYGKTITKKEINDEDFLGWYYNDQLFDFNTKIDQNYVLVAKYDITPRYTVSFDSAGGTEIESITVKENEKIQEPSNPTKEGYNFIEWQLNDEPFDFDTEITKDIVLEAKWEEKDDKITVYFDSAGGSKISNQKIKINSKVTKPKNPTKKGYKFIEWQLDDEPFDFNTLLKESVTLIAKWEEKKKYTLSFNTNGGNNINSISVYENEEVGTLPTPKKTGYIFSRWTLNNNTFNSKSKINKDTTIIAEWVSEEDKILQNAKDAIQSSYNITKSNQTISVTSSGCVITHNEIGNITRKTTDTNITLTFDITCGNKKATKTSKGIIKASTYVYTSTPSGNMINSIVKVNGVTTGSLYINGNNIGDITNGQAIVNDSDLEGNPVLQLKISNDPTIYEVKKG